MEDPSAPRLACAECGRIFADGQRCARHPWAAPLVLDVEEDRAYAATLSGIRRQRRWRLAATTGALSVLTVFMAVLGAGTGSGLALPYLEIPTWMLAVGLALLCALVFLAHWAISELRTVLRSRSVDPEVAGLRRTLRMAGLLEALGTAGFVVGGLHLVGLLVVLAMALSDPGISWPTSSLLVALGTLIAAGGARLGADRLRRRTLSEASYPSQIEETAEVVEGEQGAPQVEKRSHLAARARSRQ